MGKYLVVELGDAREDLFVEFY